MPKASEIDLSGLSADELAALGERAEAERAAVLERTRAELRERFTKEAEAAGFTLAEVIGVSSKKTRAKPAAKYRDPRNPGKTWSGRGKKPVWLQELLDQGKTLEELEL